MTLFIRVLHICCLMGTCLSCLASPQAPNNISLSDLVYGPVAPAIWYFEDKTKSLGISDAQQKLNQGQFQKSHANFNFGYSTSRYWVYFSFSIDTDQNITGHKELLLAFEYPHLDKIEVFRGVDNQPPTHWLSLGDQQLFTERPMQTWAFVVPEVIELGKVYRYWIQIETTSSVQLHPIIWDKDNYLEAQPRESLLYGVFYGLMLVMALYNAFLGYSIKDQTYFYYVGYILTFTLMQFSISGHGFNYLWPSMPWLNAYAIPSFAMLTLAFAANFSREFLRLKDHSKKLNALLKTLSIICLIGIVTFVFHDYSSRVVVAEISTLFITAFILIAATVSWMNGFKYARLFLLAWVLLLLSSVLAVLTPLGILPSNWFTRNVGQIGAAVEVILLSLALAERINRFKADARAVELRAQLMLKLSNNELQQALQLITKSNNLKDNFLATISHELRTPMNGVEGSLQVIKDEVTDKEIRTHIDAAASSANHMTQLVDSLLEYSELQSGNWKLQEQPFDLKPMISDLTSAIRNECDRKKILFDVVGDTQLSNQLIGDATRIKHVLFQLLDNAVKFTHQGSVKLVVTVLDKNEYYSMHFLVSDTGIGIDDRQLEEIFEGFKQMDGSFSRQYGGLGLGLSLCKAITDKLGGTLSIQSKLELGSSVEVTIRLKKGNKAQPKIKSAVDVKLHGKPLVLIVEDNPVNQLMLAAMVKKFGCKVEKADNGEEAVVMTKGKKYDCILMDCQMPILDGFEATRLIRSNDNINQKTSIIAVTANAMSGDRDRCLNAGMDDYIRKPVKKDIIFDRLRHWLSNNLT